MPQLWWQQFAKLWTAVLSTSVVPQAWRKSWVLLLDKKINELIYVTSQGSQLIVEALELALESFAQPCFACHVSAVSFGMVKAWIETILHVFETFLLVCRSVGRSVRLSVVPPGPRSELCGRLECL